LIAEYTSAVKIFKTKKFQTAWGASGQRQLEKVFQELRSHDFVEPQVGSDAYSFAFQRIVDDDLTQVIYISRAGEEPLGVFNFDCFFLIHSKWLSRANDLINPEDVGKVLRSAVGSSIFAITQSHLRWNESFSTENPCWYVSDLAGYEHSIDAWITDWRRLILPIAQTLVDLPSVIRHCESNQNYKADSWVKSDGYHVTLASNTALLLLKNSESVKAIELLRVALTWPVRQPIQKHFQKVLDWIESSPQV
jgi:hypothetical protein